MSVMELRQLEYFVAVAEERSFTRAAPLVHVGQSAVSVAIRSLERELGSKLFDRTTHQVSVTAAGIALLDEARRTIAAAQAARDAVAAVDGVVRGTLRIGIMQSLAAIDIASHLARFHSEHPGVDIYLRPALGGSAALAEEVRQGGIDIGFISLTDSAPAISATVLASEPFLLVGPPGSLPNRRTPIPLDALAETDFVDFPIGWGTRSAVDKAFASAGVRRTVNIEVADLPTFAELVKAGLGLGLLPRSLIPPGRDFASRAVVPAPTWDVMMVRSSERRSSAAASAFAKLVLAGD
jgi:DNA-binding transcriptional LysR family regulator